MKNKTNKNNTLNYLYFLSKIEKKKLLNINILFISHSMKHTLFFDST